MTHLLVPLQCRCSGGRRGGQGHKEICNQRSLEKCNRRELQNAFYKCSQTGLCNPFKLKTIVVFWYRAQQSVSQILEGAQIRACTSYCRLDHYHFLLPSSQHFQSFAHDVSCFFTQEVQNSHGRQVFIVFILLKMHFERLSKLWTFLRCDEMFHWYMATRTHPKEINRSINYRCAPGLR